VIPPFLFVRLSTGIGRYGVSGQGFDEGIQSQPIDGLAQSFALIGHIAVTIHGFL
jgi:hypothetical protein